MTPLCVQAQDIQSIAASLNSLRNRSVALVLKATSWKTPLLYVNHYVKDMKRTEGEYLLAWSISGSKQFCGLMPSIFDLYCLLALSCCSLHTEHCQSSKVNICTSTAWPCTFSPGASQLGVSMATNTHLISCLYHLCLTCALLRLMWKSVLDI